MASQDWFDKDFYAVLGVSKDVSDAELKKVYRKLARQFHPDSNPGDTKAEARFKEISEAYTVLSDSSSRQEYDQIRAMGGGARFTSGGNGPGGFDDVFGNIFGGGGRTDFSRAPRTYSVECSVAAQADSLVSNAQVPEREPTSRPTSPSTFAPQFRGARSVSIFVEPGRSKSQFPLG